ncbi:MAG: hypothetical protein WA162_00225 [Thermodesulfobacteriota bacterium]
MKRFVLLFILCLISTSCAWTYDLHFLKGKRFEVQSLRDIEEVTFYEGPSFNSASFHLEEPEGFTMTTFTCPEGKSSCDIQMMIDPYSGFFKVRFDSGKDAYISGKDFYKYFAMEKNYEVSPPPPPKDSMICDPIPWRKGSFRCRME